MYKELVWLQESIDLAIVCIALILGRCSMCECGHVFSALLTALYVFSEVVKVVSVACVEESIFACKLSAVASCTMFIMVLHWRVGGA